MLLALAMTLLAPPDYIASKFADHRIVIVGESHRVKHDVATIAAMIPKLEKTALAIEMIPESEQARIDALLAAPVFDDRAAIAVFRAGAWPYREYVDLLRVAWQSHVPVVAIGPLPDWRAHLASGGDVPDVSMAKRVLAIKGRVLVYCGLHHAFTRYVQPEQPMGKRATRFVDRMGNIIRREVGENAFTIALHNPWLKRSGKDEWTYELQFDAAIDCAMTGPAGFDVVPSPFASLVLADRFWYAVGYPSLRFMDIADGYVWTCPIEQYELVTLIPLETFAPDDAALAEVRANNPFSNAKTATRAEIEKMWAEEGEALRNPMESRRWKPLTSWRSLCH